MRPGKGDRDHAAPGEGADHCGQIRDIPLEGRILVSPTQIYSDGHLESDIAFASVRVQNGAPCAPGYEAFVGSR